MKIKLCDLTFEQVLQYCHEYCNVYDCPFLDSTYCSCPFDNRTPGELYDEIDFDREIEIEGDSLE